MNFQYNGWVGHHKQKAEEAKEKSACLTAPKGFSVHRLGKKNVEY